MKLGRKKRRMEDTVELNITAFLNLMVILVPFLLITAVFSRMTVLELNLPALDALQDEPQPSSVKLQLQVLITPQALVIQEAKLGELKRIERYESGMAIEDMQRKIWKPLTDMLIELKSRFPNEKNILLLLDRKVTYKTMIAVMDRVRSADIVQSATLETVELFPLVSIGDIPSNEMFEPDTAKEESL